MAAISMKQLLEAGVHFGHRTRRWNPKMSPYLFGERNGIHIIDLRQTVEAADHAHDFIKDTVSKGGTVLFVGTKKQAAEAIADAAESVEMPYVNFRWLGGMLTNFQTVQKRIYYLKELTRMDDSGEMEQLPKKERLRLRREKEKLNRNLGGVRNLTKLPDIMFVIDLNVEATAVKEARRLGIPVVAVADSNVDPEWADIVIPGNDDAVRAAQLMTGMVSSACREGKLLVGKDEMKAAADEGSGDKGSGDKGAGTNG